MLIGGALTVARFVRDRSRRDEAMISETIRPGETLVIEAQAAKRRRRGS